MSYYALVPAAGFGARMGGETPKQYMPLAGHPMIWHALSTLCAVPAIDKVFVVLSPDDSFWPEAAMQSLGDKLKVVYCGGDMRAVSVANGLRAMADLLCEDRNMADAWVLVHDAARPCLTVAQVEKLISEVGEDDAGGILAVPVADTLKRGLDSSRILETVSRDGLWQAQTPQMFRYRLLLDGLDFAPGVTDEASAIEALGLSPRLVSADSTNFKVTFPLDMHLAELILASRNSQ